MNVSLAHKFAVSALGIVLGLFALPSGPLDSDRGWSGAGQVHAAAGGSRGSGGRGGHDGDVHDHADSSSHDHDDTGDTHDHDDTSSGHKGKGPAYRGGRAVSSKGRGGPAQAVVEKIFEYR